MTKLDRSQLDQLKRDIKTLTTCINQLEMSVAILRKERLEKTLKLEAHYDALELEDALKSGKYKVKSGDTLSDICLRLYGNANKHIHQIVRINKLESASLIFAGQTLLIPKADEEKEVHESASS